MQRFHADAVAGERQGQPSIVVARAGGHHLEGGIVQLDASREMRIATTADNRDVKRRVTRDITHDIRHPLEQCQADRARLHRQTHRRHGACGVEETERQIAGAGEPDARVLIEPDIDREQFVAVLDMPAEALVGQAADAPLRDREVRRHGRLLGGPAEGRGGIQQAAIARRQRPVGEQRVEQQTARGQQHAAAAVAGPATVRRQPLGAACLVHQLEARHHHRGVGPLDARPHARRQRPGGLRRRQRQTVDVDTLGARVERKEPFECRGETVAQHAVEGGVEGAAVVRRRAVDRLPLLSERLHDQQVGCHRSTRAGRIAGRDGKIVGSVGGQRLHARSREPADATVAPEPHALGRPGQAPGGDGLAGATTAE